MFVFFNAEANPHESGSEPKPRSHTFRIHGNFEQREEMEVKFEQLGYY